MLKFQTWQETQIFTAGLTIGGTTGILQTANVKGQGTTQPHEETFEEFYAKTDSLEASILLIFFFFFFFQVGH